MTRPVSHDRFMRSLRKMSAGTMGGQSRVATPVADVVQLVSASVVLPTPVPNSLSVECIENLGYLDATPPSSGGLSALSIGLSWDGATLYVTGSDLNIHRYTFPGLDFIDTYVNPVDFVFGTAVDDSEEIYWTQEDEISAFVADMVIMKGPPPGTELTRMLDRGVSSLGTIVWSSVDGMLYVLASGPRLTPSIAQELYRVNTSTGAKTLIETFPDVDGFIRGPTATPDGGIWLIPSTDQLWRWDIGSASSSTSAASCHINQSVAPQSDGSVRYWDTSGQGKEMSSGMIESSVPCFDKPADWESPHDGFSPCVASSGLSAIAMLERQGRIWKMV